jgi:ABC-type uncharacterized transport system ATPase subunit
MTSLSWVPDLAIRLRAVVKHFGDIVAVDGLDLDVPEGTCVDEGELELLGSQADAARARGRTLSGLASPAPNMR